MKHLRLLLLWTWAVIPVAGHGQYSLHQNWHYSIPGFNTVDGVPPIACFDSKFIDFSEVDDSILVWNENGVLEFKGPGNPMNDWCALNNNEVLCAGGDDLWWIDHELNFVNQETFYPLACVGVDTSAEAIFMVGTTDESFTVDHSYLYKLEKTEFDTLWTRQLLSLSANTEVREIDVVGGLVYVAGVHDEDHPVAWCFDTAGNQLWRLDTTMPVLDPNYYYMDITGDSAGNAYCAFRRSVFRITDGNISEFFFNGFFRFNAIGKQADTVFTFGQYVDYMSGATYPLICKFDEEVYLIDSILLTDIPFPQGINYIAQASILDTGFIVSGVEAIDSTWSRQFVALFNYPVGADSNVGLNPVATPETLRCFPNPSDGRFIARGKSEHADMEFSVFNSQGILIERCPGSDETLFDLLDQPPGLYILQTTDGSMTETQKIVIER